MWYNEHYCSSRGMHYSFSAPILYICAYWTNISALCKTFSQWLQHFISRWLCRIWQWWGKPMRDISLVNMTAYPLQLDECKVNPCHHVNSPCHSSLKFIWELDSTLVHGSSLQLHDLLLRQHLQYVCLIPRCIKTQDTFCHSKINNETEITTWVSVKIHLIVRVISKGI